MTAGLGVDAWSLHMAGADRTVACEQNAGLALLTQRNLTWLGSAVEVLNADGVAYLALSRPTSVGPVLATYAQGFEQA